MPLETALYALGVSLGIISFLGGWLIRTLFERMDRLEKADQELVQAVNDLRVSLPTNYVNKAEHKTALDAIHDVLRMFEDKLDKKVDKDDLPARTGK